MPKLRVLIVDDSAAVRDALTSILQAQPWICVLGGAMSGRASIEMVRELKPDVVLMDAQLPDMAGSEAGRLIKQALPNTKVVFLAVHPQHIEAGAAAGADACLMKDCSRQDLIRTLDALRKDS